MPSSEALAAGRRARRLLLARLLLLVLLPFLSSCAARSGPVATTVTTAPVDAVSSLRHDLATVFATPPADAVLWGVRVESLDRPGEPLFSLAADRLLVPASNMKLLTVAAAAERLGWDHTFTTTIRATTALAADGTIRGDLVVGGEGDPTIGNRPTSGSTMAAIAEALWQRGVRRVDGRVIGDDRAFAAEPLGEGWAWDDLSFGYAAPAGALIYNENIAHITIAPGPSAGTAAKVVLVDPDSDLAVESHVTTLVPGAPSTVEEHRVLGGERVQMIGGLAADAGVLTRSVAVENPARYFASALRSALVARGVMVGGNAASVEDEPPGPLPAGAPALVTWLSPPLDVIATRLLKVSQNLYAETLLRALGAGPDGPASAAGGERAVRGTLEGWGVPHGAFAQSDGSGLSRYNLVTPSTFVRVLTSVYRNPRLKDKWLAALPIGGADGTLDHRLKGTAAEGRVHAKTGSLSAVRALSGYAETASGEWLVFSIIGNNFADPVTAADVEKAIDQAVVRMVGLRR
jgi:D-alanyl-D-alanine carboxypeptidase/D-alanyl-D-alanine-endopeptidase (penicillin-binding protein 4)